MLLFVSADEEPRTSQVDALVSKIKSEFKKTPSGIIGIGGGTVMDLAKAVSIMLSNKGSASDYQGWDLVKEEAVYHVGVPTISGTGAEVSRTTVDRKSTRLNSSHVRISYAVFCLKKKKKCR